MNAQEIADKLNENGFEYYGEKAKAWVKGDLQRIYFGRDFVSVVDGVPTNESLKARSNTIGSSAVEACENVIK